MTYTPTTWTSSTVYTTTNLNNIETQYDEGKTFFDAHNHDGRYYTKTYMQSTYWYAGNDGAGSGCDGDMIYTSSGNLHWGDLSLSGAPAGLIVLWGKIISLIPEDWHLCDGTSGTIDLRDKYVVGAGSTYSVGATGGHNTNTSADILSDGLGNNYSTGWSVTVDQMPSHSHAWLDSYSPYSPGGSGAGGNPTSRVQSTSRTTGITGLGTAHVHTGTITSGATENKPPSKAYCYIQKLPE
jgi:hypothetical protein